MAVDIQILYRRIIEMKYLDEDTAMRILREIIARCKMEKVSVMIPGGENETGIIEEKT